MSIIYKPRGKAREYSPLAANLYDGCNHGCTYCYAPAIRRRTQEDWLNVRPRKNVLQELEKDCRKYAWSTDQVLLCFMSDPYNSLEGQLRITRNALKLFLRYHIPVAILTKSVSVLQDLEVFKEFGEDIRVGFTLTFYDDEKSRGWEPGASLPWERIEALKKLKQNGIKTWVSFEPVIEPMETLKLLNNTIDFVDVYKLGKINHHKDIEERIRWDIFLRDAIEILRANKKSFYVKEDLRKTANTIILRQEEVDMDRYAIKKL